MTNDLSASARRIGLVPPMKFQRSKLFHAFRALTCSVLLLSTVTSPAAVNEINACVPHPDLIEVLNGKTWKATAAMFAPVNEINNP
ncbi:hypothetical protein [Prosthecobacter debontii]|nr:hypothetical protein [Prosthecobacter debontii]